MLTVSCLLTPSILAVETWLVPSAIKLDGEVHGIGRAVHVAGDFDAANLFLLFVEEQGHRIAGLDVIHDDDFHVVGSGVAGSDGNISLGVGGLDGVLVREEGIAGREFSFARRSPHILLFSWRRCAGRGGRRGGRRPHFAPRVRDREEFSVACRPGPSAPGSFPSFFSSPFR